jgi:hypothetical protein
LAHRVSYRIAFGEFNRSLFVLHKCDNRACVNPSHLFLGTNKDNMDDMYAKGRGRKAIGDQSGMRKHPASVRRGHLNGHSKLTPESVIEIRRANPSPSERRELANRFGVTVANVRHILNRKTWRHLA